MSLDEITARQMDRIANPPLTDRMVADLCLKKLSPRQRQVAKLVAEGHSNIVIGQILGLKASGIHQHMKAILLKLRAINRVEVARVVLGFPLVRTGKRAEEIGRKVDVPVA